MKMNLVRVTIERRSIWRRITDLAHCGSRPTDTFFLSHSHLLTRCRFFDCYCRSMHFLFVKFYLKNNHPLSSLSARTHPGIPTDCCIYWFANCRYHFAKPHSQRVSKNLLRYLLKIVINTTYLIPISGLHELWESEIGFKTKQILCWITSFGCLLTTSQGQRNKVYKAYSYLSGNFCF